MIILSSSSLAAATFLLGLSTLTTTTTRAFISPRSTHPHRRQSHSSTFVLRASGGANRGSGGQGFGKSSPKTYDKQALSPRGDLMDVESAMREFFHVQADAWKPLFRSMITSNTNTAAAMSWLFDNDSITADEFEFHETSQPWKRLPAIPTNDNDRTVLADFLDAVQASLIQDIPIDETTADDDEYDVQFIEEGRRMLVCSRFHVISSSPQNRLEVSEQLFATCWNELFHLYNERQPDQGSLILVPSTELGDLRRFVDMNLQRPLQWLGLEDTFEVTSLKRNSPAIRVIYKLSGIPDISPEDDEDEEPETTTD